MSDFLCESSHTINFILGKRFPGLIHRCCLRNVNGVTNGVRTDSRDVPSANCCAKVSGASENLTMNVRQRNPELALAWTVSGLLLLELIVVPALFELSFSLPQVQTYLSGAVIDSLPRVLGAFAVAFLVRLAVGSPNLLAAVVVYAVILTGKFFLTVTYIAPIPSVWFTVASPYVLGLIVFGISILVGRKRDEEKWKIARK